MDDSQPDPAPGAAPTPVGRSFGTDPDAYHRGRPGYPHEAAAWLTGDRPRTVLEVGAGTGKLTTELVALGHDVHATDPDQDMLSRLSLRLPDVRVSEAAAEELPVPDGSVDVVVGAQCFHWFDLERALPEIARVLRPGGHVAMVWNERDERIPWVRRLGRILGSTGEPHDWTSLLSTSGLFGFVDEATFGAWQALDRDGLRDLVSSRSQVLERDEDERRRVLDEALALYDGFGRGWEGMQLPWTARCFRAGLAPRRGTTGGTTSGTSTATGSDADATRAEDVDPPTDDDTGTLLIDFR